MDILKSQEIIFNKLKPKLLNFGFTNAEYRSHFCSLDFRRNIVQISNHIVIQFFNNSLGINALQGRVLLNDVNKILERFIDLKINNEFYTLNNYENKEDISNDILKLNSVSKNKDKGLYTDDIINHIKDKIFPFFSKYPDITAINEKILNKVPQKDYPEWFHGKSTLKILIIMKLCNNPKYNFYKASKEKEYLAFVNQNPAMWKPAYDTFCSLVEYLDKGHYNKTAIK